MFLNSSLFSLPATYKVIRLVLLLYFAKTVPFFLKTCFSSNWEQLLPQPWASHERAQMVWLLTSSFQESVFKLAWLVFILSCWGGGGGREEGAFYPSLYLGLYLGETLKVLNGPYRTCLLLNYISICCLMDSYTSSIILDVVVFFGLYRR